jgi:sRNA-binding regulator protein Hfq
VNRKLIRPSLDEVKARGANSYQPKERDSAPPPRAPQQHRPERPAPRDRDRDSSPAPSSSSSAAALGRKKVPPAETSAEIFYYKKQMDSHTPMVIVLLDGEEVEGTIEWYDRNALKVNRRGAPNIMLLKHNIKYMFKAEDRDGSGEDSDE